MSPLINVVFSTHDDFDNAQRYVALHHIKSIKSYKDSLWLWHVNASAKCLAIFSDAFGTLNGPLLSVYKYYFHGLEKQLHHEINTRWAGEMHLGCALILDVHDRTTTDYDYLFYIPLKRKLSDPMRLKDIHFGLRSMFLQMKALHIESVMLPFEMVVSFLCEGQNQYDSMKTKKSYKNAFTQTENNEKHEQCMNEYAFMKQKTFEEKRIHKNKNKNKKRVQIFLMLIDAARCLERHKKPC